MKTQEPIYRVIFSQDGQTYELYARYISEETMVGFVEIDQLIFAEDSTLVDPTEEKLKNEFRGVERIYVPMHAIFRIDEVMKEGPARIKDDKSKTKSNVWHFPIKKQPGEDNND
ncbi:MAG: DUF1820 family protein [Coxiellaceae bacterium]|nr:DUF1820 family protein [Coxiellaceae bacterium]